MCDKLKRIYKMDHWLKHKTWYPDFPDYPVVKNPPCNARDIGLIPGQGTKIPHASEQHASTKFQCSQINNSSKK